MLQARLWPAPPSHRRPLCSQVSAIGQVCQFDAVFPLPAAAAGTACGAAAVGAAGATSTRDGGIGVASAEMTAELAGLLNSELPADVRVRRVDVRPPPPPTQRPGCSKTTIPAAAAAATTTTTSLWPAAFSAPRARAATNTAANSRSGRGAKLRCDGDALEALRLHGERQADTRWGRGRAVGLSCF